jgi:hypothetical protein
VNIFKVQGRILCFDDKGGGHNDKHVEVSFNYPGLTHEIQTRLMYLYFYSRNKIHLNMPHFLVRKVLLCKVAGRKHIN